MHLNLYRMERDMQLQYINDSKTCNINEKNGVIIHDTAKSVCDGLNKLQENLCKYNSKEIVFQSKSYHWSQIVNNRLLKLFI